MGPIVIQWNTHFGGGNLMQIYGGPWDVFVGLWLCNPPQKNKSHEGLEDLYLMRVISRVFLSMLSGVYPIGPVFFCRIKSTEKFQTHALSRGNQLIFRRKTNPSWKSARLHNGEGAWRDSEGSDQDAGQGWHGEKEPDAWKDSKEVNPRLKGSKHTQEEVKHRRRGRHVIQECRSNSKTTVTKTASEGWNSEGWSARKGATASEGPRASTSRPWSRSCVLIVRPGWSLLNVSLPWSVTGQVIFQWMQNCWTLRVIHRSVASPSVPSGG